MRCASLLPPRPLLVALAAGLGLGLGADDAMGGEPAPATAPAAPPSRAASEGAVAAGPGDSYGVRLGAETFLQLFRRAALPGPGGALVTSSWAAPVLQSVSLRVDAVDLPWQTDGLDVELAAWGSVQAGELGDERRVDGDVSVAFVRSRFGPVEAALGRQIRVGGAARFCRFDGATVGVTTPFGLGAEAYGGFTVLPRWSDRPGYQLLGSAADTLLRAPDAVEDPARTESWVVGGRAHFAYEALIDLGASFHESHAYAELDRRNLGFEARTRPLPWLEASGHLLLDGDQWVPNDARAVVDLFPLDELTLSAEYTHLVPALLLSSQSVLAAFSTDRFHEAGGRASYRPVGWLELGAAGYAEIFPATSAQSPDDIGLEATAGLRVLGSVRVAPFEDDFVVVHASYGRTSEPRNGYHATRVAVGLRPLAPLGFTAEGYLYLYDEPVRLTYPGQTPQERALSCLGTLTSQWRFTEWASALLGSSLATSPYAALDAQLFARVSFDATWGDL